MFGGEKSHFMLLIWSCQVDTVFLMHRWVLLSNILAKSIIKNRSWHLFPRRARFRCNIVNLQWRPVACIYIDEEHGWLTGTTRPLNVPRRVEWDVKSCPLSRPFTHSRWFELALTRRATCVHYFNLAVGRAVDSTWVTIAWSRPNVEYYSC